MDYLKEITDAVIANDWDRVIDLATEAKSPLSFFGIKKGVLNVFDCYDEKFINNLLKIPNYLFFQYDLVRAYDADVRAKKINADIINNNYVIIIAYKKVVVNRLINEYPVIKFKNYRKAHEVGDKNKTNYVVRNLHTKENFEFEMDVLFKSINRNVNLNKLLD